MSFGSTIPTSKVKLFVSCAQEDESFLTEFEKHLFLLKEQGIIEIFHYKNVPAGQSIGITLTKWLDDSNIIILMLSVNFLNSHDCYKFQMIRSMERLYKNEVMVIPILLADADYSDAPFVKIKHFPIDGNPISQSKNQHELWTSIVIEIRKLARELINYQDSKLIKWTIPEGCLTLSVPKENTRRGPSPSCEGGTATLKPKKFSKTERNANIVIYHRAGRSHFDVYIDDAKVGNTATQSEYPVDPGKHLVVLVDEINGKSQTFELNCQASQDYLVAPPTIW